MAVRARTLTPLELRIVQLVEAGRTTADAAAELGLAPKTVDWHLSRAFRKLDVRCRSDLAALLARDAGDGSSRGSSDPVR